MMRYLNSKSMIQILRKLKKMTTFQRLYTLVHEISHSLGNENKKGGTKVENKKEKVMGNSKQDNVKNEKNKKKIWIIVGIVCTVIILAIISVITVIISTSIEEDNCTNNSIYNRYNSNNLFDPPEPVAAKPIIYLYPKKETEVTVKLGYPEKITCSYPKYEHRWTVTANPDGTLIDEKTGKSLYSLYWEGKCSVKIDTNEGFVIEGEKVAEFLEEKLAVLGLTEREAEEFIIYWLPKLECNKYNYIRFASIDEINEYMPLDFSVQPDSLIRVLMQYKGLDEYMKVTEQKLETPERTGFVAVEWGGSEIK